MPQLLEQPEILHVSGAHLNHVDIRKIIQLVFTHDFRHDRQAGHFAGDFQQAQSFPFQSLKGIG